MATLDKQKIDVAVTRNSKIDHSSTHITTASFMTLQPVYYLHCIPKQHITGSGNVLSRLAPVAVPTYGRCRINLRSFFVPFRTIFPNFNEFITDTIGSSATNSSLVSQSPYVTNLDFVQFFLGNVGPDNNPLCDTVTTAVPPTPQDPYDFETATGIKKKLSFYGRQYLKILNSLGYKVIWDDKNTSNDVQYSALPIMAYAKVYCDWYANQAYLNSAEYLALQQMFKFNNPTSVYHLDVGGLANIFQLIHAVCYDSGNDVYINAWDNPVSPNRNLYSGITGNDVTAYVQSGVTPTPANAGFQVVLDSNGTPYIKQSAATSLSVGTEYMHDFLKSATDYIKRNQLSGAAQVDRFLARFGIALDSAKVNRSIYVSSQSIDIDFGSVMSHADTSGAGLGDYSGQGLGRGELSFDYATDEYGMFIVMASILPDGSLYQGYDRNIFHLDKLSFFTPEFDNLGCQAIRKGEVYVSTNGLYGKPDDYDGVFGFAPRYYEYKFKQNFVTGDFISPATMSGGDSWFLMRQFDDSSFNNLISRQVHSLDFTRGDDATQYNRIFSYTGLMDKFYLVYHFDVGSTMPCKSLFDSYDFEDAGQTITMNGQSAKVN